MPKRTTVHVWCWCLVLFNICGLSGVRTGVGVRAIRLGLWPTVTTVRVELKVGLGLGDGCISGGSRMLHQAGLQYYGRAVSVCS